MATKPCYESEPIANLTLAKGAVIQGQDGTTLANVSGGASAPQLLSTFQTIAANSTGTQASGIAVTAANVGVTSAGAAYSITLPVSVPGMEIDVVCETATNTVKVYPNAGGTATETINALSANAGITMAALTSVTFICLVAGQWWTNPRVPS